MKTSTCIVTQSLSCSLVGLGEPVDCGVVACGGLWIKNKQVNLYEVGAVWRNNQAAA